MMRATEVLTAHHDQMRALMTTLAEIPPHDRAGRRQVLDRLMAEMTMHEQIEDELFYPAVRDVSALTPIAHSEHRQLSDQLAVVLRTDVADDRFDTELAALRAAVEHHAGKEESEMFPEVVAKVDDGRLRRVGEQLADRLAHLRASPVTRTRLRVKRWAIRRL